MTRPSLTHSLAFVAAASVIVAQMASCSSFDEAAGANAADASTDGEVSKPDATEMADGGAVEAAADAKVRGSCSSDALAFAADFSSESGLLQFDQNCAPATKTIEVNGPQAPYARITCTTTGFEAFSVYQTATELPEKTHLEAELLVRLDRNAPEHAFAQAVAWLTDASNLRFFSGPDGVSVHVDNGPALASWKPRGLGFYLLELQLTRIKPNGGDATGRTRVVFDGEARTFDLPIVWNGAGMRAPKLQIGPYFPLSDAGSQATDSYDSIKLWSCD